MISFVIPAHDEEAHLPASLDAFLSAADAVGRPYEVIVVNDASTDATGDVARRRGVRVVEVVLRGFYTPQGRRGAVLKDPVIRRSMKNRTRDAIPGFQGLMEDKGGTQGHPA